MISAFYTCGRGEIYKKAAERLLLYFSLKGFFLYAMGCLNHTLEIVFKCDATLAYFAVLRKIVEVASP